MRNSKSQTTKPQRSANSQIPTAVRASHWRNLAWPHSFSIDRGEDQHQFLCLSIQLAGFNGKAWFGSRDHSRKKHRLFSFFGTSRNAIPKVLRGNALLGLTVVRSDAGARADYLIDKSIVSGPTWNPLRKVDNRLSKSGCSLFQIERMLPVGVSLPKNIRISSGAGPGSRMFTARLESWFWRFSGFWVLAFGISLHSLVIVSSRFRSTRATVIHAPDCLTSCSPFKCSISTPIRSSSRCLSASPGWRARQSLNA